MMGIRLFAQSEAPPGFGDFRGYLAAWQHAAMTGFRALAQFDFDHFDLVLTGIFPKLVGAEGTIRIAAAEIATADFPYQVATHADGGTG